MSKNQKNKKCPVAKRGGAGWKDIDDGVFTISSGFSR